MLSFGKYPLACLAMLSLLGGCAETSGESGDTGGNSGLENSSVSIVPAVTFNSNLNTVAQNGSITLTWSASNVDSCMASGDWSGSRNTTGTSSRNNLTSDKTYILTCSGPGGSVSDSVSITVVAPSAPVVNISANPLSVAFGGSTQLQWNTSNVNTCTASGNWSGIRNTSGSSNRNNLTSDRTYILTCTGPGGNASDSVTVSVGVAPPPAPTLSFSANPTVVSGSGSTTLSWSTTDADDCLASGNWFGNKNTSGNQTINSITSDRQYTLSCNGAGGSVTDSVNISYSAGNTAPQARAGIDQTVTTGALVTLDGGASSDADNDPLLFSWSFTSRPSGSSATLVDSATSLPSFTADVDGTYVISLVVNDGSVSAADSVVVTSLDSSASIYYVSNSGSNSNDGSSGNEWKTISYGISRLQSGDTLIVRNGTYSGSSNFITGIPSGTSGNFTTVMAETPFGVRIANSGSLDYDDLMLRANGQYIHVDGFIFDHSNSFYPPYTGEVSGQRVKLTRSAFRREGPQDEYGGWLAVSGSYHLVEDVAGVGTARYGFYTGGTSSTDKYIIFRRVVGRLDYADSSQPKSTFVHYGNNNTTASHHIVYQNCIALDSNQPSYDGGGFGTKNGGIKVIKTAMNDIISGSIVLNERLEYQAVFLEGKNNRLENTVIWDNRRGNYGTVNPVAYNVSSGFTSPPHNSVVSNVTAGQNQNSSADNTSQSGQDYLPRPDDYPQNSGNKAVVLKRIGVAGTFYGDPGWDTVTNEDLWPWPYEDEIKAVFAENNPTPSGYTPPGNTAARGFAASGNGLYGGPITLTSYIWEYLGNPCPSNYCN